MLNPEDQSKNLYSPIFRSIPGIKKSANKEIAELKTYIKLTFSSPEKIERKLELMKDIKAICKENKKPNKKIFFNFEFFVNISIFFTHLRLQV